MENKLIGLVALENYQKALINVMQVNAMIAVGDNDLSEDEDDEKLLAIIKMKFQNQNQPKITGYVNDVVNFYDEIQFQQNFRMKRTTFEQLFKILSLNHFSGNAIVGRPQFELKHQLLVVIWVLATPDSYRSISERFNVSKSVLSRSFVRIINALNAEIKKFINFPTGAEIDVAKQKFSSTSIFKNLIGAVDGTYVALSVPKSLVTTYTNQKCFTSMTLQAICDADMRYVPVYSGCPSSVADIRKLKEIKNSDIYNEALNNMTNFFPNGEYILGDKAYPNLDWCITPYINRGNMNDVQIQFNNKHSSCRQVVERSFALLFGRFRRLKQLDLHRLDWAPATINACCILHNICLDFDIDILNQYIAEGTTIQATNNTINNPFIGNSTGGMSTETMINNGAVKRNLICQSIQ